jgi:hypothetical protein
MHHCINVLGVSVPSFLLCLFSDVLLSLTGRACVLLFMKAHPHRPAREHIRMTGRLKSHTKKNFIPDQSLGADM